MYSQIYGNGSGSPDAEVPTAPQPVLTPHPHSYPLSLSLHPSTSPPPCLHSHPAARAALGCWGLSEAHHSVPPWSPLLPQPCTPSPAPLRSTDPWAFGTSTSGRPSPWLPRCRAHPAIYRVHVQGTYTGYIYRVHIQGTYTGYIYRVHIQGMDGAERTLLYGWCTAQRLPVHVHVGWHHLVSAIYCAYSNYPPLSSPALWPPCTSTRVHFHSAAHTKAHMAT